MKRALFILLALVGVVAIVTGCGSGNGGEQRSPQQEYEQSVPEPEQQQTYADPTNVKWGEGSKVNGVYVEISQPRWTDDRSILTYDVTVGNMSSWPVTSRMTDIYVDGVKVEDHTTRNRIPVTISRSCLATERRSRSHARTFRPKPTTSPWK